MTTSPQSQAPTHVEDYLEGEQRSDIKHEYLAGQVVAMVGATHTHNRIAGALYASLLSAAHHKGCGLFMADMKVRIDHADESDFYYPEVMLTCAERQTNIPCTPRNLA